MSQRIIYISRIAGKNKKGRDFDIVKVATPDKMFEPFMVQNGVGDELDRITEGDDIEVEWEVVSFYGNASPRIVRVL